MKWFTLVAALLLFAGCGDVNWFPDNTTPPTTTGGSTSGNATAPNAFQFTAQTATVADAGGPVLSNSVTIAGDNPNGWAITLSDSPASIGSEVLINNTLVLKGTPIPNIKPGQTLIIEQTVPATVRPGDKLTTTVTVGTFTTQFVTTIQ